MALSRRGYHWWGRAGVMLLARSVSCTAAVAIVLLSGVGLAWPQASIPDRCRALAEFQKDLYLVSASGNPISRFTSDGGPKSSISLSPDGKTAAFVLASEPDTFRVAHENGRQNSFSSEYIGSRAEARDVLSMYANNPLTDVSFVNSDTIKLTKHISPTASRFEFYRLVRNHSFQLESKSSPHAGAVCSIAHGSDKVACIQGSQILINDNVVFVRDALVEANKSESLRLKVGSVEGSNNAPSFKIQVTSLNDGVNLRVGLPTGNWIASRIVDGAALPVTFEDRIYNFIPTIVSRSGGIVNIDVLVSAADFRNFDRAISWRSGDGALAIIERTGRSVQMMLLMKRPARKSLHIVAQKTVDIPDPVLKLRFGSGSRLMFETGRGFGEIDLRRGLVMDLPRTLAITIGGITVESPVSDWSCL